MMTSRSEYRLILRQDNADERLVGIGTRVGLNSQERWEKVQRKYAAVQQEIDRVEHVNLAPSDVLQDFLKQHRSTPLKSGCKLSDLIRRPELKYDALAPFDPERPTLSKEIREQVEIRIKYEGYIKRQLKQVEQFKKLEEKKIPEDLDYEKVGSLRIEARQKLEAYRPISIGQASRISGVSPADISVLLVYLESHR